VTEFNSHEAVLESYGNRSRSRDHDDPGILDGKCERDPNGFTVRYTVHYVEGLRGDDDGQIGVCWDKVGLDHFGGLLPAGGHTVLYLFGNHGTITAAEWPNFLDEQQKLIAKSKAARRNEAHKR